MKEVGKVFATTDYEQFVLERTNESVRLGTPTSNSHIKKLEQSLIDGHIMIPALVSKRQKNGKFIIIEGQHRFMASKALGAPFTFTVQLDDIPLQEKIRVINSNMKPWNSATHIESLSGWKHDDVIEFKKCAEEFGLGYSAFNALCTGKDSYTWASSTGEVPFDVSAKRKELSELKSVLGKKTRVNFVCQAIHRLSKLPNASMSRIAVIIAKCEKDKAVEFPVNPASLLDFLVKKYNHGLPEAQKTYRIVK